MYGICMCLYVEVITGCLHFLFVSFLFWRQVSHSPDWPRAYIDHQAGLKLVEIHLALPLRCWD